MPVQAYYGAWYYIPSLAKNSGVWNLFHFTGGSEGHGLWDVSLINSSSGALQPVVYRFPLPPANQGGKPALSFTPEIPIRQWFHLEVFLKRAQDATGEVQVYLDGVSLLHLTNLVTDDTDWGQWYVGNLATDITPPEYTLYVDDVTIGEAR